MMQQYTIHIAGGVARNPLVRLAQPVSLDFLAGEHIAIVGPNGSGKSLLVDMLTGKYPCGKVNWHMIFLLLLQRRYTIILNISLSGDTIRFGRCQLLLSAALEYP